MAEWEKDSKMFAFLGILNDRCCYYEYLQCNKVKSHSAGETMSPKSESSVSPAAQGVELSSWPAQSNLQTFL